MKDLLTVFKAGDFECSIGQKKRRGRGKVASGRSVRPQRILVLPNHPPKGSRDWSTLLCWAK